MISGNATLQTITRHNFSEMSGKTFNLQKTMN